MFLDVLFPLNLKKIIFVDTDQIVRTDLIELRDLDLGGAPYGYTPFCDSNEDMEGFRLDCNKFSCHSLTIMAFLGSGSRVTGGITWQDASITSLPSMWWIL